MLLLLFLFFFLFIFFILFFYYRKKTTTAFHTAPQAYERLEEEEEEDGGPYSCDNIDLLRELSEDLAVLALKNQHAKELYAILKDPHVKVAEFGVLGVSFELRIWGFGVKLGWEKGRLAG